MAIPNHLSEPEFLASTPPELRLTTAVETIRKAHDAGDQELELQSLAYLRAHAANGQQEARTKISTLYEHGDAGVPKDTQEAMIWSRSVFDKQIAKALQLCAEELADPEAMRRHPHSTYALIAEAAKQAQPNASYLAGIMLMKGVGVSQNVDTGLSHLISAAEADQVDAQYELGRFYGERFKYSRKDTKMSLYWYDRAVQNGDTRALIDLAYTYFEGDEAVPRDYERAFQYAKQGAETGDKYCQYIVGDLYLRGRGTAQNPGQAVHWLTQSGEQGFSMAIEELAVIFFKGFGGVAQNYESAYYWCTKGAEVWPSGLGYCQAALGDMYRNGYYVNQDTQLAYRWYQKAANQTNSPQSYAQYILGEIFLNGEGVQADRIKAMEWFQIAADRGYEAARKKLERMRQAEAEEEDNGGFVYRPSSDSTNGSVSLPSRPPSPMFPRPVSPTTPTTSQDSYNFNATPPALPSDEPKKSRWSLGIFGGKRR